VVLQDKPPNLSIKAVIELQFPNRIAFRQNDHEIHKKIQAQHATKPRPRPKTVGCVLALGTFVRIQIFGNQLRLTERKPNIKLLMIKQIQQSGRIIHLTQTGTVVDQGNIIRGYKFAAKPRKFMVKINQNGSNREGSTNSGLL